MKLEFESKGRFLSSIAALPLKDSYKETDLLNDNFRIFHDAVVDIYYTPFDYIKTDAKLVLVGITPGWTQMELAFRVFRTGLESGNTIEVICADLERKASFAGSMKTNLICMLAELNLDRHLGVRSVASLFSDRQELINTTSALRYATFVNGKNYTGHKLAILQHGKMKELIDTVLGPELRSVPNALIIPLGQAVSDVLRYLASLGQIGIERCLLDFPHPSGANGHRKKHFESRKLRFSEQVQSWFADEAVGRA